MEPVSNLADMMSKLGSEWSIVPSKRASGDPDSEDSESNKQAVATVNSQTVVKLQTFQSPASFARLQCNTDLNTPPSNWLTTSANSYGLQQALSHSTGFTSFRMAHMFPDSLGEIDVVSSAENIKKLLKLPYSAKSGISLMIHRIENTLLIDDFDIHKYLLRQADDDWQWLKSFMCEHILSGLGDADRRLFLKNTSREAIQQRSLQSKFLYHSLTDGSGSAADEAALSPEAEQRLQRRLLPEQRELAGPLLPEPSVDENVPDPQTNHTFNRNVVWTFEDIRMLIGTDMPIFGSAHRPCISLRLRDMKRPINVLTGIDYWLDNLMCNVPEVVMCYHLDGLVQKYELIPTEDLPNLENSQFSPKVIRNVAQNILAFLKQNATKAGHTYWLFKGRNDDFVKLYDLTSLCMHTDEDSANTPGGAAQSPKSASARPPKSGVKTTNDDATDGTEDANDASASSTSDKTDENPFTVPVAMLLYKVARNMKNMAQRNMSAKQAGSIKTLLDNCIQLLPKEKYPQIVTSSHYILSDLHVPAGIDPNSPDFSWSTDEKDEVDEDDPHHSETQSTTTTSDCEDNHQQHPAANNATASNSLDNSNSSTSPQSSAGGSSPRNNESVATKNISDTLHEFNLQPNWKHNASPPPIVGGIRERCEIALQHIVDGLGCLQYFSSTVEKLSQAKAEEERAAERRRIREEEQNPTMANARHAIPLPYESLRQQPALQQQEHKQHKKKSNKSKKQRRKSENSKAMVTVNADGKMGDTEAVNESPRALLLHGKSGVIESWHVHLKLLLLEKACLTYATLTEQSYSVQQFGHALRYIQLAMQCQLIVTKYMRSVSSQKLGLLGRAGDCYFRLAKTVQPAKGSNLPDDALWLAEMCRCFEDARAVDVAMRRELAVDLMDAEDAAEMNRLLTEPSGSVEALMVRSCACYQSALMGARLEKAASGESPATVRTRRQFTSRLGSVSNELGVKYMHWAQQEYAKYVQQKPNASEKTADEQPNDEPLYQVFIKKSYDCLVRGIGAFEEIEDKANLAILLCNMGRFKRFRAHVIMIGESDVDIALKRMFYDGAFTSYQRALGVLETRKCNPVLWDLVNWELSTSTFTLAQHIIDNTPAARWMDPDAEQEIIELLLRSLKMCDTETVGERQVLYAFRQALVYQRLGEVYARSYKRTCGNSNSSGGGGVGGGRGDFADVDPMLSIGGSDEKDSVRRKKMLQLCRMYYGKAAKALAPLEEASQYLRVLCDRMALQEYLAKGTAANMAKIWQLQQSLQLFRQSEPVLRSVAEASTPLDDKLAEQLVQQVQMTLRTLIKLCMAQQQQQALDIELYKKLYSLTLRRENNGMAIGVLCRLLRECP